MQVGELCWLYLVYLLSVSCVHVESVMQILHERYWDSYNVNHMYASFLYCREENMYMIVHIIALLCFWYH